MLIQEMVANETALHIAAQTGYFDLVKTLVEELNVNMNIETLGGKVALHYASWDST